MCSDDDEYLEYGGDWERRELVMSAPERREATRDKYKSKELVGSSIRLNAFFSESPKQELIGSIYICGYAHICEPLYTNAESV